MFGRQAPGPLALRVACLAAAMLFAPGLAGADPPADTRPIGVFDSGTGGLTVLEQLLSMDRFENRSHTPAEKGDGQPDFQQERFIFLADQANMPYGNYPVVGKEPLLVELIRNDAQFLLGKQFFVSPGAGAPSAGKQPVKALVIACNTATAYGKQSIESLVARAGLDLEVIGVIDAGAQGALEVLAHGPPGTIGVLATEGTVASGAYSTTIRAMARQKGLGAAAVIEQGAYGLAGAVDGAPEFILRKVPTDRCRPDYRGPALGHRLAPIDLRLLPRYAFDFTGHAMLWEGEREHPSALQINSVDNYLAYHLVSLLESVRSVPEAPPLSAIVLGCTHFPFLTDTFRAQLQRLYDYREKGQYVYRPHMVRDVQLIDPAFYVGKELYVRLARKRQLASSTALSAGETRGEFYITVPCRDCPGVQLNASGWFTYDYKYGRSPGRGPVDVRTVPLAPQYLESGSVDRLARQVPATWRLIGDFRAHNAKIRDTGN